MSVPAIRHAVAAFAIALGLAGCSGEGTPLLNPQPSDPPTFGDVKTLEAGACLSTLAAKKKPLVLDADAVSACDEKHAYEVTGVVDIPWNYFKSGEPNDYEFKRARKVIGGDIANNYEFRLNAWAEAVCEGATQRAMGLDQLELNGEDATKVRLTPFVRNSSTEIQLISKSQWDETPQIVCTRRFHPPAPGDSKTSTVSGFMTAKFLTSDFAPAARWCTNEDGKDIPCDQPHFAENTFAFDALAAFGEEEVAELRDARMNSESEAMDQWRERLNKICTDTHNVLIGRDWDNENLAGRATFGSDWSDPYGSPEVICSIVAATDGDAEVHLPPGSVIGLGDAVVETVQP